MTIDGTWGSLRPGTTAATSPSAARWKPWASPAPRAPPPTWMKRSEKSREVWPSAAACSSTSHASVCTPSTATPHSLPCTENGIELCSEIMFLNTATLGEREGKGEGEVGTRVRAGVTSDSLLVDSAGGASVRSLTHRRVRRSRRADHAHVTHLHLVHVAGAKHDVHRLAEAFEVGHHRRVGVVRNADVDRPFGRGGDRGRSKARIAARRDHKPALGLHRKCVGWPLLVEHLEVGHDVEKVARLVAACHLAALVLDEGLELVAVHERGGHEAGAIDGLDPFVKSRHKGGVLRITEG